MYQDNSPLAPIFSRLARKLNCRFKVKLFFGSCLVSQLKPFLAVYVAFVIDKHLDGKARENQFPSFAEDNFMCRFTRKDKHLVFSMKLSWKKCFFPFSNTAAKMPLYISTITTNKPKITSCPRMLADLLKELHVLLESWWSQTDS